MALGNVRYYKQDSRLVHTRVAVCLLCVDGGLWCGWSCRFVWTPSATCWTQLIWIATCRRKSRLTFADYPRYGTRSTEHKRSAHLCQQHTWRDTRHTSRSCHVSGGAKKAATRRTWVKGSARETEAVTSGHDVASASTLDCASGSGTALFLAVSGRKLQRIYVFAMVVWIIL